MELTCLSKEKLSVDITPDNLASRTLSASSILGRSVNLSGCGRRKTICLVLYRFITILFWQAQSCKLVNSSFIEMSGSSGTSRFVSSANLKIKLFFRYRMQVTFHKSIQGRSDTRSLDYTAVYIQFSRITACKPNYLRAPSREWSDPIFNESRNF
jgi:hypothetical protein